MAYWELMIEPLFIEENLNGPNNLNLLQQQIVLEIRRIEGGSFNYLLFQQDGCSVHTRLELLKYLKDIFPNCLMYGK